MKRNRKKKSSVERRQENADIRKRIRKSSKYRDNERIRDIELKQKLRKDPDYRETEKERDLESRRKLREDPDYRETEKVRDMNSRRKLREDPDYREKENQRNLEIQQKLREDPVYREKENQRNLHLQNRLREDPVYREKERDSDRLSRNMARQDSMVRTRENEAKSIFGASWDRLLELYNNEIKQGSTNVCASCGGLWFEKSIHIVTKEKLLQKVGEKFLSNLIQIPSQSEEYMLCGTCFNSCNKKAIPKRNLSNGFRFPELPSTLLNLTQLEERLISARLPFMQIRSLGIDQQKGLKGNVVNVPNDLDICAKALPREFDQTSTIQVQLMRRMCYKNPFIFETIRPQVVFEAAKYLCTSELYKKEGILLSDDWYRNHAVQLANFVVDRSETQEEKIETEAMDIDEVEDISDEEEDPLNAGSDETLIMSDDNFVVKIAPGEGQIPIPWLRDIHAEQLSFPSIYGGVQRKFNEGVKISIVDIARSEARMYDRRAVKPLKVLYSAKLLQNHRLADEINICLRKRKGNSSYTASEILKDGQLEKLISHDDGFKCLRGVRSSPAFWEAEQKKVLAMIRQTFLPTFFVTLSAAETKWPELLVNLELILHQRTITEEEAINLPFERKAELIRNDPISCALYFDHRLRSLLNLLLNKPNGVFSPNKLLDHYCKIEFAHRGSAHCHGLYWLSEAPVYDPANKDTNVTCVKFVDQFISCRRNGDDELEQVVGYQIHKHSHTCKQKTRSGNFKCRFNLPLPPMPETRILLPLPTEADTYKKSQQNFLHIQEVLNKMGRSCKDDIPFPTFLSNIGLSEEEYIDAIRTSISRDKVFLVRRTCDIFVNAYNPKILTAWKANMDIQFVLDPYACVKYCVTYLTKSFGGISKLMRDVEQDLKRGNMTLQEKLRAISNKFINSVEISAQEAAYLILGLNLTNCSRSEVFINTGVPEERVQLLKPMSELKLLPNDSQDIAVKGLLDHYSQRPRELDSICLADFASNYNVCKNSSNKFALQLLDYSGYVLKRIKPRIVRYRRYNQQQDPINYFREQLMLYKPWRNEGYDLNIAHNQDLELPSIVLENRKNYDPDHKAVSVEEMVEKVQEDLENKFCEVDEPNENPDYDTDMFDSIKNSKQLKKFDFIMPPKQIPHDQFIDIVRRLNERQRMYFMHLIHKIKTSQVPFYDFVSGGAGVGKSHLITAIVQGVTRYLSKEPGINLENPSVLICAPTGKAAFNIFGITMHCAFRLPPNQYAGILAKLPDDICNSMRLKFSNLQLIIIDEISMVSLGKLHQINARLQQIRGNKLPFGGISVLVVGDFYQIRPVMGQFVFEIARNMPFGAIIGNQLWSNFAMFELTQIMRQEKALAFAVALNNLAQGCMTFQDIELLKSREMPIMPEPPLESLNLFWSNAECDRYNSNFQEALQSEWAISLAHDTIQGSSTQEQKDNFSNYVKSLSPKDTDGLANSVRLQIGCQYMISTNVDVADGLFNGSTGELMKIEYASQTGIPHKIYMNFENPTVGVSARLSEGKTKSGIDKLWTPVRLRTDPLRKIGFHQGLTVTRRQIPMLPANGITVTKSQGSNSKNVVLHLGRGLRRDLLYVGCSRTFTPDGLFINGNFQPPGPPPKYLVNKMARLREQPLQLCFPFLQHLPDSHYKLIFHNVQSLNKHFKDIISDQCFLAADVICLVEPWTLTKDSYVFPGYHYIRREDSPRLRSSLGSFVGSKSELKDYSFKVEKSDSSSHFSFSTFTIHGVTICMVYRSPSSSIGQFNLVLSSQLEYLSQGFLIVIGDFNIDIKVDKHLLKLFSEYGLRLAVPSGYSSTDGQTQIDSCFCNFLEITAWYYESVFSYHKPICVTWPKDQALTKQDIHNIQIAMDVLDIKGTQTETHSDSIELMECDDQNTRTEDDVQNDNVVLPAITLENYNLIHWNVNDVKISLLELKSLSNELSNNELNVLQQISSQTNEEFLPKFLTDKIIHSYVGLLVLGRTNFDFLAPTVTKLLVEQSDYELPIEGTESNSLEYVFLPIHHHNHWMLLIVQPQN